jgi:hypothetical protein
MLIMYIFVCLLCVVNGYRDTNKSKTVTCKVFSGISALREISSNYCT